MSDYFMLAANDAYSIGGARVPAIDLAETWLNRSQWPLYSKNKNRKSIAPNARLMFYVGGTKRQRQTFIGTAKIERMRSPDREERDLSESFLMDVPERIMDLTELEMFSPPVAIRPLLGKLSLVKDTGPKWGVALVGGSRRMTEADYQIIRNLAQAGSVKTA